MQRGWLPGSLRCDLCPAICQESHPEEVYETIRRRARAAGQSIQADMRDQVVELAHWRTNGVDLVG